MSKTTSGEWFDKSFNPINGRCPNNCVDLEGKPYCYMWRPGGIGDRFAKVHDHPLRLDEKVLNHIPKSGRVFVGSSTDMWHDNVPNEWLAYVLCKCHLENAKGQYFFLTKNPKRYMRTPLIGHNTKNHWFGTTWDGNYKSLGNITYIAELSLLGFNTFISFEPLLASPKDMFSLTYSNIKWIIIGADSRKGKPKPPKEWSDYLIQEARRASAMVFVKDNYGYPDRIKELPEISS